jgi:hypothetical protein
VRVNYASRVTNPHRTSTWGLPAPGQVQPSDAYKEDQTDPSSGSAQNRIPPDRDDLSSV